MKKISYWLVFCLIFVIFSLYIMGDAFYRWDGFRLHSTFIEFMPSVALALILWSIVALLTSTLLWLLLRATVWVCDRKGLKITIEHLIVHLSILIILGVVVWEGKKLLWPLVQTSQQTKLLVFICVSLLSIFLAWLFRDRAKGWITIIHERITPLVWLFGIFLIFSVLLVAYQTWFKDTNKVISQKITQSSVSDKKRPNIILVTFDSLTARNMSVYSYHRPTTPFITEWAKEATLFTNLQAVSNWTVSTTASLMTGKREWTHRSAHVQGSPPLKSDVESIPLLLKKNGYFNIAYIANSFASVKILGIDNSFDIAPLPIEFNNPHSLVGDGLHVFGIIDKLIYSLFADKIKLHDWIIKDDFILGKLLKSINPDFYVTLAPPENAFNEFLAAIDKNPPEPYFAWIHIMPPHVPYLPPEPYMGMFDSSSEMRTFKSQWKIFGGIGRIRKYKHFPVEVQLAIDVLRARYDEFIRYCDKQFEEFIEQLTERDKLKNTVIILSSDHGESFEHDYLGHGGPHLYEQLTHIPLIIKEPLQKGGRIIHGVVEQVDISASILDLAGITMPSWIEGHSFVPTLRGKNLISKPAFSMNFEGNTSRSGNQIETGSIAVWEGDYKLIHYLGEKKSLLFNLKRDPNELDNLINVETEVGSHLLDLIQDNLKKANERILKEE